MANSTGPIRGEIDRIEALGGVTDPTARADATAGQFYVLSIPIDLSLFTVTGDVLTDFKLGHKFELVKAQFVVTEVLVGTSGAVAIGVDVGATPVTGGVSSLAVATGARGHTYAGSTITAGNTGASTDVLSVTATVTTAFTTGKGILLLTVKAVA